MKNKLMLFVVMVMVLVISACGSDDGNSSSEGNEGKDSGDKKTIRAGIGLNENHPQYEGLVKFKEIVEEETDGGIEVETYPSEQLGSDRTMAEGLQLGSLEVTVPSTAPMVNFVPEMAIFDFPFLFPDVETADAVLDGPVGQELLELFDDQDMKALAYWENGFRDITNSVHEIETADDFEGLKVRTMENDMHLEAFSALGANPTPMAMGEVFTALQQGTVDGQENPLATIYIEKFYEAQDYVSTTHHIYSPFVFLMSKEFYDELSEDEQQIVSDAAVEAGKYERQLIRDDADEYLEKLEEEGMTTTEISPEAREEMEDIIQPVIDKYTEEVGESLVEEVYDAVEEASK